MDLITPQIKTALETQSWIRRMFEIAAELKAKYGADRVFDFSLGNPDLPPPPVVAQALHALAERADRPSALGYCPNAGLPHVRKAFAERISREQQTTVEAAHVVATCGAAGALNALFRAILQPGDEVLCPSPFFAEYAFYVSNFGGRLTTAPAVADSFALDVQALAEAISPVTRALLINSPNNPTGAVYSRQELEALAAVLKEKSARFGRPILLILDEPYRFLTYDGVELSPIFPLYDFSILVTSFSKSLSLAGERIGYLAVHPKMEGAELLLNGVILTNRILGYVNAPVVGQ